MRLSEGEIEELARATERFSFAYLKELFRAGMTRWMHDKERGSMMRVLVAQLEILKSQMTTGADAVPAPSATDGIEQLVEKVRKRLW
jgi:hypothetical protein